MHRWKLYIAELDDEINELVEREAKGLTAGGEKELHILFENRKHAVECLDEKEAKTNATAHVAAR